MRWDIWPICLGLKGSRQAVTVACLLGLCLGLAGGCGRKDVSDISGKITCGAQPVSHGIINFVGSDNQPHGGPIAADGSYACQVPLGNYAVIISAPALLPEGWHEGDPAPDIKSEVPEKYAQRQTSNLTAPVTERKQTIDFKLP